MSMLDEQIMFSWKWLKMFTKEELPTNLLTSKVRDVVESTYKCDPFHAQTNYQMALMHQKLRDYSLSVSYYTIAERANPLDCEIKGDFAVVQMILKNYSEARDLILKSKRLRPERGDFDVLEGILLEKPGTWFYNLGAARNAYRRAVDKLPNNICSDRDKWYKSAKESLARVEKEIEYFNNLEITDEDARCFRGIMVG